MGSLTVQILLSRFKNEPREQIMYTVKLSEAQIEMVIEALLVEMQTPIDPDYRKQLASIFTELCDIRDGVVK